MILLVSGIERRQECAEALQQALQEPVVVAENLLRATTRLRAESYTAVVFDDKLAQSEPDEIETALEHLGTAIPLEINLAISGSERLIREVRSALRRRKFEEAATREAVTRSLRDKLNGTLTTLLLDCELALEARSLPPAAMERLASVHGSAKKLRMELELTATAHA
jgi:hypothetical protein